MRTYQSLLSLELDFITHNSEKKVRIASLYLTNLTLFFAIASLYPAILQ